MAYSDFDLKTAVTDFGLSTPVNVPLFADVAPVDPSDYLRDWLAEFAPVAMGLSTEAGRREAMIFPILAEAKRRAPPPVTIASGVTFDVDKARGLSGMCDYILTRSPNVYYVTAPAVAVVEAKREDLISGLGQCVAEMVAIQLFNEQQASPRPLVYGRVTTGNQWRFLRLDGKALAIDSVEYSLDRLPSILGILVRIASE
ncbi:MAG TPA: hypothetical protein VH092_06765 [Urbifossiella sp.]|nr:hypothetical protein [Urbifossiella sp.]